MASWPASISEPIANGLIEGFCAPEFERVYRAFRQNFEASDEQGAAVSVSLGGETVVDLWGGLANPADSSPWKSDTLAVVFSCTKAATALAAHILADRGALDLDAPVADYWPEFAAAGKGDVTVRMLLDHTAGLPALRDAVKPDCLLDWQYMTDKLATAAPEHRPGAMSAYHGLTYGWLIGEVIQRVADSTVSELVQSEIAAPLKLDGLHIGVSEKELKRIATLVLPPERLARIQKLRGPLKQLPREIGSAVPMRRRVGWFPRATIRGQCISTGSLITDKQRRI